MHEIMGAVAVNEHSHRLVVDRPVKAKGLRGRGPGEGVEADEGRARVRWRVKGWFGVVVGWRVVIRVIVFRYQHVKSSTTPVTETPFVVVTIAEFEFTFAGQLVRCEALKGLFGW